jgi:deoxyribodipyrimidine photo-lyase
MKQKCNIFWFRRDLRFQDNHGLYEALQSSSIDCPLVPVFIFDKEILKALPPKAHPFDKRVSFIHKVLSVMKEELLQYGSDLLVTHSTVKKSFEELAEELDIQGVFANEDYEPEAIARDSMIERFFRERGILFHSFKDQSICCKDDILKKDGLPYTVYTPYKKRWYERLKPSDLKSFPSAASDERFWNHTLHASLKVALNATSKTSLNTGLQGQLRLPSIKDLGFQETECPSPEPPIDLQIIKNYDEKRDIPSIDTTKLGIHLRFGTISIRKCAAIGFGENFTWLNQLIWRDFFMTILFHFPYVVNRAFKSKYDGIRWLKDAIAFEKWKKGQTGFPIVDAGMRELNETGFMHNRVRMITASFLVKDLLIDWRLGERYFARKLLDYDLAANNGNWQWAAGTGCDAAPYFRIFNPMTQQKKFDPQLTYVKKWVPELHTDKYSKPMIDHKMAYHRTLDAYKTALATRD